jgi:hypothetical protein
MAAVAVAKKFRTKSTALFKIGRMIAWLVARMDWTLNTHHSPRENLEQEDMWSRTTEGKVNSQAVMKLEENYRQQLLSRCPGNWVEIFKEEQGWVKSTYDLWPDQSLVFPPIIAVEKTIMRALEITDRRIVLVVPEWINKWWWRKLEKYKRTRVPRGAIINGEGQVIEQMWRWCIVWML